MITTPGHEHGRDIILKYIRKNLKKNKNLFYVNSLGFKNLLNFYKYSNFVIGNSSSGIGQAPYFRIPTINIGERQKRRYFHPSIINCGYSVNQIKNAIQKTQNKIFLKT